MQNLQTVTADKNWKITPLEDCVDILDSQRIPVNSDERANRQGNIPYYGATGQVGWIDDFLFNEELVLLGEDGAPFLDKTKPIAYIINGKSWVNNHAHVLRGRKGIADNWYIKYYLDHIDFTDYVAGTTRLKLTQTVMKTIPIMLPELSEQEEIASLLRNNIDLVNDSKSKLSRAKTLLSKFRQAILSAAVSGRLTEEWRKTRQTKSAREILVEIRERRLDQSPAKKKAIEKIYAYQEEKDSSDLPENWEYVVLDKLCESFQYGTSTKSEKGGKVVVLRMGNLQNGELDWSDLAFTSNDLEIEKYKLNPGDVLFNRTNSPELVGKTSIYRGEKPAIFAGYLIKINNYPELDSEYLNFFLNSGYAKAYCRQVKTDGVSQSNINAQKLSKFEIPFCSIEEQKVIVERAKVMLDIANKVEQQIGSAIKKSEKLTQAILAKTFREEMTN